MSGSGASGPPIGTVTCLFSDIEGSTRLEIELGTGPYRDIRERHRELLRVAFAAHDGYEQGTEGDSFFVIFRSATEAITAAAEAQRALATEPWPDGVEVRVRMGLHTGDIESTGVDVIGYAINRTARIAAVAHGGQVLVSDATRALVAGTLPDGIGLRDLGEHRLKDLRAPMACPATSRRPARSTHGRTTCRPSSRRSSGETGNSAGPWPCWERLAC